MAKKRGKCGRRRAGFIAYLLVCASVLLYFRHTPSLLSLLPPCLFRQFTGLSCAACGITRAADALARGDLLLSIRCNLLLIPAALLFGFWILFPAGLTWRKLLLGVLPLLILYMVLRNLPFSPCSFLLPPE